MDAPVGEQRVALVAECLVGGPRVPEDSSDRGTEMRCQVVTVLDVLTEPFQRFVMCVGQGAGPQLAGQVYAAWTGFDKPPSPGAVFDEQVSEAQVFELRSRVVRHRPEDVPVNDFFEPVDDGRSHAPNLPRTANSGRCQPAVQVSRLTGSFGTLKL